jgi:hypothetical protein
MVTFDTQKLFVGYQLEQMDTAAAAAALQDMLARRKKQPANGPKPLTLDLVDQYEEDKVWVGIVDTSCVVCRGSACAPTHAH